MITYIPMNPHHQYVGLSTDSKPMNLDNGATFLEMDTGEIYFFDKENNMWRAMQ